jgi:hypothetical protein
MPHLNIQLSFGEGELEKAIEFIYGRDNHTEQIKKDFFPDNETIKLDISAIQSDEKAKYMMTGFISSLIVFQETINLQNHDAN